MRSASSRGSQTARWRRAVSGSRSGRRPAGLPGQSPVDWWREDGVSFGRAGGASRRWAQRGRPPSRPGRARAASDEPCAAALPALGVARSTPRTHGGHTELPSPGRPPVGRPQLDWGRQRLDTEVSARWAAPPRAAAKQPDHVTRSAGRGLGAAQRGCRGRAPLTLGGKIESASAGPGERAGDGPSAPTHLLYRPGYAPRPVARQPQGRSKVPVSSSLFAVTAEVGGGSASAADWTSRRQIPVQGPASRACMSRNGSRGQSCLRQAECMWGGLGLVDPRRHRRGLGGPGRPRPGRLADLDRRRQR
jgi:hypothetical protein